MTFLPISQIVAPEALNLGGARGDLEPMVTDQEEVVGSLLEPIGDGASPEDGSQYFRRESGYP